MSVKFDKLKDRWYKKLKKSGFRDIEYKDGTRERGGPYLKNKTQTQIEAIEAYYTMARHFLIEYTFPREIDKVIWEYYSEGLSYRDIEETLKKAKVKNLKKSQIKNIITALEKKMKEKYLVLARSPDA